MYDFSPMPPDRDAGGGPPPSGARLAPICLALTVASIPVAAGFSLWGLDGVNHCDRPSADCGLGFAVLIPLAWLFSLLVLAGVIVVALRTVNRATARATFLSAAALIWLVDVAAMSAYRPR